MLGKYRRAFWLMFKSESSRYKFYLTQIISGLITVCSMITSFIFVEVSNSLFFNNDHRTKFIIKRALIIEIIILIFFVIELLISYFVHSKLQTRSLFLILIHFLSLVPITFSLVIWVRKVFFLFNFIWNFILMDYRQFHLHGYTLCLSFNLLLVFFVVFVFLLVLIN